MRVSTDLILYDLDNGVRRQRDLNSLPSGLLIFIGQYLFNAKYRAESGI